MDELEQDRRADWQLAELLLRGGVGLRHVRRTLRELRDHRRDLVEKLTATGHEPTAAIRDARQLLGERSELAKQMIARPELRSRARRFAWLVFVLGPLPMIFVIAFVTVGLVAESGLMDALFDGKASQRAVELVVLKAALQWFAPLVVSLLLCRVALLRRIPAVWPLSAAGIAALGSGLVQVYHLNNLTTISVGWPPPDLARTLVLLCVLGAAYMLLRQVQSGRIGDA